MAKQLIIEISAYAGIRPAKLIIKELKPGGYACYSPIPHRIYLSKSIFEHIERSELRTLLAHEVCHSSQRKEILFDGLFFTLPGLMMSGLLGLFSIYLLSKGHLFFTGIFAVGSLLTLMISEKYITPIWEKRIANRECEADSFANMISDSGNAMKQVEAACINAELSKNI